MFVWTRRKQFWQLCGKFYAKCQKNFAQSPTTQQKEKKLKNLFLQHVFEHVDNSSDKLSQVFCRKPENVSIRFRKTLRRSFQKKVFSIKVFVSLFRKQFSQFCKKKRIQKLRDKFDQKPKEEEEFFNEVVGCTSKCSSERLESSSANFED